MENNNKTIENNKPKGEMAEKNHLFLWIVTGTLLFFLVFGGIVFAAYKLGKKYFMFSPKAVDRVSDVSPSSENNYSDSNNTKADFSSDQTGGEDGINVTASSNSTYEEGDGNSSNGVAASNSDKAEDDSLPTKDQTDNDKEEKEAEEEFDFDELLDYTDSKIESVKEDDYDQVNLSDSAVGL